MGGKRIIALVILCSMLVMTGCGMEGWSTDDYRSMLKEQFTHAFSVKKEIGKREEAELEDSKNVDLVQKKFVYKDFVNKLCTVMKNTKYSKYLSINEETEVQKNNEIDGGIVVDFTVDLFRYAKDILEKGRKEGKLPDKGDIGEEDSMEVNVKEKFASYEAVKVDNCIFYVYQGKVQKSYYVALSKDQEWQQALQAQELGYVGELFSEGEDSFWKNPIDIDSYLSEKSFSFNEMTINTGKGDFIICISDNERRAIENNGQICAGVQWLEQYWNEDAWGVRYYTDGKHCDMISYEVEMMDFWGDGETGQYYLEVLGDSEKKEIEEIIYQETVSDTLSKSIPSYLQPTVISYLMGLGVSEKEAEEFVNALPEKSTILGEYQVAVDKGKGKIKIYRPY